MFDIVQTVVDKEAQFRDDAQLVPDACAQLIPDLFVAGIDVLQDFLALLTGKYGEVGRADAQVGGYLGARHRDHCAVSGPCLLLEYQ